MILMGRRWVARGRFIIDQERIDNTGLLKSKTFRYCIYFGTMFMGVLLHGYVNKIPFSLYMFAAPFLRFIDAENAHNLGVFLAARGWLMRWMLGMIDSRKEEYEKLGCEVWGMNFKNPLGLAAGFDKDGRAIDGMLEMGFGFVEIGSVLPKPQSGNPKPRVFRLFEDRCVINRYGLNSEGHDEVGKRLHKRLDNMDRPVGFLGINLGANKETEDEVMDFVKGIRQLLRYGDYVVINVSCPNVEGHQAMQQRDTLTHLLKRVKSERDGVYNEVISKNRLLQEENWTPPPPTPLLIKISPDLTPGGLESIAQVAFEIGVDGIICGNTTTKRPDTLKNPNKAEKGGLSGEALFDSSTLALAKMYHLTEGKIPLIGCGGVSSGEQAYRKILAGASLVELYTALIFKGPTLVHRIKRDLNRCLERDGYSCVADAVGAAHRQPLKKNIPPFVRLQISREDEEDEGSKNNNL